MMHVRSTCFALLSCGLVTACFALAIQDQFIDSPSGVMVNFVATEKDFPENWQTSKFKLEPLPPDDRSQIQRILTRALRRYPDSILLDNLQSMYVLKELVMDEFPYGSTNDCIGRRVYLTYQDYYPARYLESSFHSEFAYILLYRNSPKFKDPLWKKLNTTDFISMDSPSGDKSTDYSVEAHKKGFLSPYGASGPDADFKTFAEGLFTGGPKFWAVVDKYPKVKAKAREAIIYYKSLSPKFTEKYFRSLK